MKNILLVEDLGIDVMLTRLALEGYGWPCRIMTAGDGEAAYQLLKETHFDLLLLDIKMPLVDGFELMERVQRELRMRLPTIIVSGSGLLADRARAKALGAIDYVQKAVDYSVFKEELRTALRKHGFC